MIDQLVFIFDCLRDNINAIIKLITDVTSLGGL